MQVEAAWNQWFDRGRKVLQKYGSRSYQPWPERFVESFKGFRHRTSLDAYLKNSSKVQPGTSLCKVVTSLAHLLLIVLSSKIHKEIGLWLTNQEARLTWGEMEVKWHNLLEKSLELIKLKLLVLSSEIKCNPKENVANGVFMIWGKIFLLFLLIFFAGNKCSVWLLCHCGFHQSRKLNNFIGITKMLVIPTELNVPLLSPNRQK